MPVTRSATRAKREIEKDLESPISSCSSSCDHSPVESESELEVGIEKKDELKKEVDQKKQELLQTLIDYNKKVQEDEQVCFFCLDVEGEEGFMNKMCKCKGKILLHHSCCMQVKDNYAYLKCTICQKKELLEIIYSYFRPFPIFVISCAIVGLSFVTLKIFDVCS